MTAARSTIFLTAPLIFICTMAWAQSAKPLTAWAPQPVKPAPFTAPNKPLKKFVDIMARHRGKADGQQRAFKQQRKLVEDDAELEDVGHVSRSG